MKKKMLIIAIISTTLGISSINYSIIKNLKYDTGLKLSVLVKNAFADTESEDEKDKYPYATIAYCDGNNIFKPACSSKTKIKACSEISNPECYVTY